MRTIILHLLVETEDAFEAGAPVGRIELTPEGPRLHTEDADLRARLTDLLAHPIAMRGASPSSVGTASRPVSWRDGDAYARALLERLEKPDLRLRGRILD